MLLSSRVQLSEHRSNTIKKRFHFRSYWLDIQSVERITIIESVVKITTNCISITNSTTRMLSVLALFNKNTIRIVLTLCTRHFTISDHPINYTYEFMRYRQLGRTSRTEIESKTIIFGFLQLSAVMFTRTT